MAAWKTYTAMTLAMRIKLILKALKGFRNSSIFLPVCHLIFTPAR